MHNLRVKRLRDDAIIPTYATDGSGCFDLYLPSKAKAMVLNPYSRHYEGVEYSTPAISFAIGLAFEIPKGFAMMIYSRSGMGIKHDVRLSNCTGVIDSDFRGEIHVKLRADEGQYFVKPGERIAQAMVIPVEQCTFEEVEELSETVRGKGGYGSTGK